MSASRERWQAPEDGLLAVVRANTVYVASLFHHSIGDAARDGLKKRRNRAWIPHVLTSMGAQAYGGADEPCLFEMMCDIGSIVTE